VSHGSFDHAFSNEAEILGTINIIINVTIKIVSPRSIIGYIIAHLTFHFNSIFSSKFVSSSANILPNCPVFSHTFIRDTVKLSNTLG